MQYRIISVLALSGVVLGAWYMLWLVRQTFFGPAAGDATSHGHDQTVDTSGHEPIKDLGLREILALAPLAVLAVWIGVWPQMFLQPIDPCMERLANAAQQVVNHQVAGNDEFVQSARTAPDGNSRGIVGDLATGSQPSPRTTQVASHGN